VQRIEPLPPALVAASHRVIVTLVDNVAQPDAPLRPRAGACGRACAWVRSFLT
jgi:hypothetical protein